jgi:NAD-dependent dihydropyrimidine dehydrogenase PreA subunit
MPPEFKESCISCFKCVEICPCDILRETEDGPAVAYPEECWHCGACMMDCPTDAIKLNLPLWVRPVTRRLKE